MAHWLFKTEPDEFSIDDLARDGTCKWEGVRNYQARNRLRDEVNVGDDVLIHHSSCRAPGIVGLARVVEPARPDPSQFDPQSPYHDPRATQQAPRWFLVTLAYAETFPRPLTLAQMRQVPELSALELLNRSRLSIQTIPTREFAWILDHCRDSDAPA